jgi:hypothetical protein
MFLSFLRRLPLTFSRTHRLDAVSNMYHIFCNFVRFETMTLAILLLMLPGMQVNLWLTQHIADHVGNVNVTLLTWDTSALPDVWNFEPAFGLISAKPRKVENKSLAQKGVGEREERKCRKQMRWADWTHTLERGKCRVFAPFFLLPASQPASQPARLHLVTMPLIFFLFSAWRTMLASGCVYTTPSSQWGPELGWVSSTTWWSSRAVLPAAWCDRLAMPCCMFSA